MTTPPQELESIMTLIRQRKLYLEGVENQVQRQLKLLADQKKQLAQNKAALAHQEKRLRQLAKDETETVDRLKVEAENRARREVLRLYEEAEQELVKLKKQKSELERDSGSQARIMADLHQDIEESQVKLDVLLNSKVALTAEQATIQWDTKKESGKLRSIENSIITQQEKLEKLQFKVKEAVFTLEETINKDITTRAALAEKEIKLREEKINLKNKEEAIKKELLANEQLRPDKWDNLKRFDDIKEHLRL